MFPTEHTMVIVSPLRRSVNAESLYDIHLGLFSDMLDTFQSVYEVKRRMRGRAVIINNELFQTERKSREGNTHIV